MSQYEQLLLIFKDATEELRKIFGKDGSEIDIDYLENLLVYMERALETRT